MEHQSDNYYATKANSSRNNDPGQVQGACFVENRPEKRWLICEKNSQHKRFLIRLKAPRAGWHHCYELKSAERLWNIFVERYKIIHQSFLSDRWNLYCGLVFVTVSYGWGRHNNDAAVFRAHTFRQNALVHRCTSKKKTIVVVQWIPFYFQLPGNHAHAVGGT